MATGLNTIVLKGKGHHDEGIADATIYPGEAVRMAADGHYDPESLTADAASKRGMMLAKEDALQGKTTADAYAATDTLFFYYPLPGDHIQVLAKISEDIDVGDYLDVEGSGSGKFIKVSASATATYPLPFTQARVHDSLGLALSDVAIADVTVAYKIPVTTAKVFDARATNLPATAANDDMAIIGAAGATPRLQGVDFGGTSTDEKCAFEYIVPQAYKAGSALTLRVMAGMITTVANPGVATQVDAEVYRDDGIGGVSADLCATAAQSINSLTHANKDFVITPTTIGPGDKLIIELDFIGTDSGDAGVMIAQIDEVSILAVTGAVSDDMVFVNGTTGTAAPMLQGADFGGTSTSVKAAWEFILPPEYRAGSAVTVVVKAGMITTVANPGTAPTVDCEVWKDAGTGLVGSDLCTTAAQSINSLVFANKSFVITPTGLVAGDKLIIRLSLAGTDSGDAGVMIPAIEQARVQIGNAAAGRLMALEDTDGALAAAALVRCLVMSV